MCRIFGFRSVIQSQVHRSLVDAENALCVQSGQNPDGWGVAYYLEGAAHLLRSPEKALDDQLFTRVSGVVASETVLAHVRKATVGNLSVLNCHPFQYGRWTFAHNGEVRDFARYRDALRAEVAPRLRRYILGDTDSEVIFFLFLTELSAYGGLSERYGAKEVATALTAAVRCVRAIADGPAHEEQALLTLIVTDGQTMVATQGGKELHYSTYKTTCADRDTCPHLAPHCEAPTETGFVNHLLFSSEPTSGEAVWHTMKPGDVVGVDWRMRLFATRVDEAKSARSEVPLPIVG